MSSLHTALRRISNTTNLSDKESLIQEAYNRYLTESFMVNAERHHRCDAYFDVDKTDQHKKSYAFFCEYKADLDLEDPRVKAGVVAQAVVYYHRFKNDPEHRLPSSLLVADLNEAFVVPTFLFDELKIDVDLDSITPSSASSCEPLVNAILDNKSICKYTDIVLKTQDDPDAALVMVRKIEAFGQDRTGKVTITQSNIAKCFNVWQDKIVRDKELTANESVAVFLDAIRYPERRMSNDKMLCVYPHKPVKVNGRFVEAFFNMFEVLPDEKKLSEFSRYYDTMVKEDDRRRKGFFITPKLWVDLAHKYVAKKLGEGWESNPKNVVWDCCAGTKALTRDYWFGNLWVSTLEHGELDASSELSTEAKKTFKFDFLNQGYEELPFELRQELESIKADPEKKLVFFVNPPYGTAGDYSTSRNAGKMLAGAKNTVANKEMLQCNFGLPCRELFCQFLFRMNRIADDAGLKEGQLVVATFSNPTWMAGNSFKKFRKWVNSRNRFHSGFIFEASEFEGCSGGWPIAFTVIENIQAQDEKLLHDCYESDELGLEAEHVGTKEFHSTDGSVCMDEWTRIKKVNVRKVHYMGSSALTCIDKEGALTEGFLGSCVSGGNIAQNQFCFMMTGLHSDPKTFQFTAANFDKACCVYAARSLIANTWINHIDNYFAPNEQHPLFDTFVRDARVYSIFSYQTSVAGDIDGEHYDYINSFCPFTKREVLELRGEHVPSMMPDESRFIRSSGKLDNLTPEAQLVLDLYKEAIKAVAPELEEWDYQHPELQLSRWDAGWRQYRDLIKEKAPEANQKLRDAIKALGNKLRPLVYELGFLKQ